MSSGEYYYWDSCVFLSYLNGDMEETRMVQIEGIIHQIRNSNKSKIATSVLSKVEVAWIASEKNGRKLNTAEESTIDLLWNDNSVFEVIEFNDMVASTARNLLRDSMSEGWKLKPLDAIHLATAKYVRALSVSTYDDHLFKFSKYIEIPVSEPKAVQPKIVFPT